MTRALPRDAQRKSPPRDAHREEQLHGGFHPVTCGACRTTVLVRHASTQQTSIQWPAGAACPELIDRPPSGAPVLGCGRLTAAIRAAESS
ncbi:hypothetical protein [Cryptosporangium aurantiacum]|uniref:Ferredoxin n=1 Tax=Cryptosporangium aurantiacum TaxID=134849 RepID=A0A1M7K676_9ACTN|nr:hypothetical protein [Cryptosporangium aurantiacum]SHM60790.1 hypothetical protein SAMN05443668_1011019 [Cryptosporangium aurantiacum]